MKRRTKIYPDRYRDLLKNESILLKEDAKLAENFQSYLTTISPLSNNYTELNNTNATVISESGLDAIAKKNHVSSLFLVFALIILLLILLVLIFWSLKKVLNLLKISTPIDDLKLSLLSKKFLKEENVENETVEEDNVSRKSIESDSKLKDDLGELEFSLDYDFVKQELSVSVLQCRDLPPMDMSGKSDPYVKCYILPEKKKKYETKVHRKSLNPIFNETFVFKNIEYNFFADKTLVLAIFDFDRFSKHDQIGEVSIPLGSVDFGKVITEFRDICPPKKNDSKSVNLGDICFSIRYVPNTGKLTVCILEAKNLKQMDIGGLSDPFVKIYLMNGKKRLGKKKTTVQKCTLSPYFNEAFTFEVPNNLIQSVHLIIAVYDYDLIGASDLIGKCTVGGTQTGTGQIQWLNMLAAPRRPIANWHNLQYPEDPKNKEQIPKLVDEKKA